MVCCGDDPVPVTMDPPPPFPSSSRNSLTAEQLERIALNKKRAQELRMRKRPVIQPITATASGQNVIPQAKRPPPPLHQNNHRYQHAPARSLKSSAMPTSRQPYLTAPPVSSRSSSSSTSIKPDQCRAASYFNTGAISTTASQNPISAPSSSVSMNQMLNSGTHLKTAAPLKAPPSVVQMKKSSVTLSESQNQFIRLKNTIKAEFVIVSKSRFKVLMPYDAEVIAMFQKMKTRSYG